MEKRWFERLAGLLEAGMTNEEICKVLGVSTAALNKRVARAGLRFETYHLRRRLAPREHDEGPASEATR